MGAHSDAGGLGVGAGAPRLTAAGQRGPALPVQGSRPIRDPEPATLRYGVGHQTQYLLCASREPFQGHLLRRLAVPNQGETIQIIGHELIHQVVAGDRLRPRALPAWYNEGLAEHVGSTLVGRHRPACGAWLWTSREQWATTAIRAGQYPHLASLASSADWRAAADGAPIYAESALAVRWLADHFGVGSVMEVVRATGVEEFGTAFERVFGFTPAEFETIQANALRAPAQCRQPARTQPPPCSIPSLD